MSVTFTPTKIEICPVPKISIIMDGDDGYSGMSDSEFPEANPVIFGCIDMRVTDGLKGQMNPREKVKFYTAGEKAKVAWYNVWWPRVKIALFTLGGILFAWFLLKGPSEKDEENFEEFDDEKFFEEYGEFYSSTETEDDNEDDLYDELF